MEYGLCHLSVIPMRAEPSDKAEIINQVLFGETLSILSKENNWMNIQLQWDDYEGWIDPKQITTINVKTLDKIGKSDHHYCFETCHKAVGNENFLPLTLGASLPFYDGLHFKIKKEKFLFSGKTIQSELVNITDKVIEKCALKYLNAPYLWGGKSPFGIDCSGFTQMVFKMLGKKIKRDSYQQAQEGEMIDFLMAAKTGDLAFFCNKEDKINHVGILLDNTRIIHAHGQVRIDKIDTHGIFNADQRKYTHKLKLIKRIF